MDEPQEHHAERKKPVTEDHAEHDPVYMCEISRTGKCAGTEVDYWWPGAGACRKGRVTDSRDGVSFWSDARVLELDGRGG